MMIIISSISSGLEFWWVSLTSVYKNSQSKVNTNITFLTDLLGTSVYKTLESYW